MNNEFIFPPKLRGVPRTTTIGGTLFRGSTAHHGHHVEGTPVLFGKASVEDDDMAFVDTSEECPPALPYSWEVCASNTYISKDFISTPQGLRANIKEFVCKTGADIISSSLWDFKAVIYPEECKTVFKVSIFDSTSHKNACLVEMELQEGDRVAFQGLCSYVQSQVGLKHAFADKWGFDEDQDDDLDEWKGGYQHRSLQPLPLPSSLLSELTKPVTSSSGHDLSPLFDQKGTCFLGTLLENTRSPFGDVRRAGWQELAQASNDGAMAEALLNKRVNGDCIITMAGPVLRQTATCNVTEDTQRCVLKTLLNIARIGSVDVCRKIRSLKTHIITLTNGSKKTPVETRTIGVRLMQCLVASTEKIDQDLVVAIRSASNGKCRVSDFATQALESLKISS